MQFGVCNAPNLMVSWFQGQMAYRKGKVSMSPYSANPPRPAATSYDKDLQMFKSEAVVDPKKLNWMRWLVEQGRVGHTIYGPPTGEYAEVHNPAQPLEISSN